MPKKLLGFTDPQIQRLDSYLTDYRRQVEKAKSESYSGVDQFLYQSTLIELDEIHAVVKESLPAAPVPVPQLDAPEA
jgi:hypothetical protein